MRSNLSVGMPIDLICYTRDSLAVRMRRRFDEEDAYFSTLSKRRCVNIPARYCTGYLGDIGVPPPYGPMDFSAWFEAYLNGRWYTFDARNNIPRIGCILIARGRDAADAAISSTFGPNTLKSFKVRTDEVRDK